MSLQAIWPEFLRPQLLWLLLLLPLLCWWQWRRGDERRQWEQVVDAHLLPSQLLAGKPAGLARWRLPLALLLACVALAGPSWGVGPQASGSNRHALVLAVDLSSAMYSDDVAPTRLLRLRSKLSALLAARSDGETALVVYAADAYTVVPLTQDSANLALYVDALAPTVMPEDGQRADLAIARSAALLQDNGIGHGQILLLAGAADAAAASAAAQARAQGWPVSVLAVRAQVDGGLQAVASAGGGRARAISLDSGDLQALGLLDAVAGNGPADAADRPAKVDGVRRDDGFWLLPLVLLLLAPSLQRGAWMIAAIVLVPLLLPVPAQAADNSWWQRADQRQYQRNVEAVTAYRAGDYARAEAGFAADDSAQGHYNRGNALARQGKLEQALVAYDTALGRQQQIADESANRDI